MQIPSSLSLTPVAVTFPIPNRQRDRCRTAIASGQVYQHSNPSSRKDKSPERSSAPARHAQYQSQKELFIATRVQGLFDGICTPRLLFYHYFREFSTCRIWGWPSSKKALLQMDVACWDPFHDLGALHNLKTPDETVAVAVILESSNICTTGNFQSYGVVQMTRRNSKIWKKK